MGALTDWLTSTKATAAVGDWITEKLAPKALQILEPLEKPMMAVDKFFELYVRDPIGAAALQNAYAARGEALPVDKVSFSSGFMSSDDEDAVKLGPLEITGEAGAATQRISYGEATQYALWNTALRPARGAITGIAKAIGGKTAVEKTYDLLPLLNPDYDLLDEKQRLNAQDSPFYQFVTGLTDVGLEIFVGGKGVGAATRAIKVKSGLQRNFKNPEEVVRQLETEADFGLTELQRQANVTDLDLIDNTFDFSNITAANGITEDIIRGIKATDHLDALKIPSIYNSPNPLEMSKLVALARTPREVADLMLADLGSTKALKQLGEIAPVLEDAYTLTNKPLQLDLPLGVEEVANVFNVMSDVATQQKSISIINDIIKRDPNGKLGNSYQAWYTRAEAGAEGITWAPSKFRFQEKINSGITGWKIDRLIGARDGVDETLLGGGMVRPFRLLTLKSLRLKPRNWVEWGTARGALDSLDEISAIILSNKTLRKEVKIDGLGTTDFRKEQLRTWNNAIGEEGKVLALKQIEENLANRISQQIAQELKTKQTLDPTEALRRVQRKRDELIGEAKNTQTGIIAEGSDGLERVAVNETMKFKLKNAMPMLDLNLIEREIRAQYGASLSKRLGASAQRIPLMFDSFERAFSAAVLIRPGYIPKNSIFEPFMRTLGMLHAVSLTRLFRKNVVEVDVIDDVTGQTVSKKLDILAPDTPGGSAVRDELSPAITLANATKPGSYIEADIASGRVTVDPANAADKGYIKQYYNTYATRINQFKQDPVSRRIMDGANNDNVAKYLVDDLNARGGNSDFYRTVQSKLEKDGKFNGVVKAEDLNYFAALEIAQSARREIFDYLPTKELQRKVLDEPTRFTGKTTRKLTEGKKLPALQVEIDNLLTTGGQGALVSKTLQKGINVGFRAITKPETELFRIPFARYYGNMRVQQLVDGYQKQGIPITSQLWENTIRPVAQEYAIKQVEQTFYAIRRMNNVQYYSRFLMAFPNAMFNSIKFWTRQGFNNPYNFALLEQLRTSPWAMGMVVDEEGNKISIEEAREGAKSAYYVLPFFNKPDSKYQPFVYKMNVDQLNFLVNGPSPNWLGQASVNTIIQANPTLETSLKELMGEKAYNRIVFGGIPRGVIPEAQELKGKSATDIGIAFGLNLVESTFIPGGITSAAEFIKTTIAGKDLKFDAGSVGGTLWSVHTARRIDWELNNPDSPEPSLDESIKDTQRFMFWRFATRLLSPLGVTQQPTTIFYRNEYDRLEEEYVNNPDLLADRPDVQPYQAAVQDFITMYGNEAMRALVSSIKFTTSVAPEQETVRRLESYDWLEDFVGGAPATRLPIVGMVLNPVTPGEYSPAAGAYLRTQEIAGEPLGLGRKTFAEREREALEKEGWREYDKIVKKRDAALAGRQYKSITARLNNDVRQEYIAELNALTENNEAWEEAFGNSENTFPESVNLIRTALDNEKFIKDISRFEAEKSLWSTLDIWLTERDRIFPEWQSSRVNSEERERLKAEYENLVFTLSQSSTYFSDFATRYLNGDPMIDVREVLMTAEELG
jgi:hypothetical protein